MSKKLKLDLKELKVQSFVTAFDDDKKNKLKGGSGTCEFNHGGGQGGGSAACGSDTCGYSCGQMTCNGGPC